MSQAGVFVTGGPFPPGSVVETLEGNTGGPVGPDGTNNINVVGDGVGITVAGNAGTNTLTISLVGGGSAADSFPTDNGTATPVAGVLEIIADTANQNSGSSVSFSGASNTVTLNVTDGNDNTIIGEDSGNATLTGTDNTVLGASSARFLTSGEFNTVVGAFALPDLTTGIYNVIIGNAAGDLYASSESNNILIGSLVIGTVADQNTLRIGVDTGTGQGELNKSFIHGIRGVTPDIADGLPVIIDSDGQLGTGGATLASSFETDLGTAAPVAGVLEIIADNAALNSGSTVLFTGSGNTVLLNVTDAVFNTIVGKNSGNLTIVGNDNTILGGASGSDITSGSGNTVVGTGSLPFVTTGDFNIVIGDGAAGNYTGDESSNILIGHNVDGLVLESNTLRIGAGTGVGAGALNQAFISGIDGVDVGSVATVVTEFADQLGTAVITGGSGITVTPGVNSIVISGSGTIVYGYTNVNTSPYVVLVDDDYISVDSSGGAITIQLPNAATLGKTFIIKDRTGSAGTNNITVTTVGGAVNIDGATTFVMNTNYQAISIIGNSTTYEIF